MIKTTYKYTKDKNLVWNQYTLFDSLRFIHSKCGSIFKNGENDGYYDDDNDNNDDHDY